MSFSSRPSRFAILAIVLVLVLLHVSYSEARKVSEKSKLANQKTSKEQQRCTGGKDKDGNCKTTRQSTSEKNSNQVGLYSPFRSSFTNHFINALTFAERIVLDFSREILTKYGGWERNGWEMNVLEMVVKTISKDIVLILQAMQ